MVPLKGQCHEIFFFRFFSWIIFLQAPENNIRVISNASYICGDIHKSRCTTRYVSTTPVVDLELRISPRIFEKSQKSPHGILRGLVETDSWKTPVVEYLVAHIPLTIFAHINNNLCFLQRINLEAEYDTNRNWFQWWFRSSRLRQFVCNCSLCYQWEYGSTDGLLTDVS